MYVCSPAGLCRASLFVLALAASRPGVAGGYYNLGAFWQSLSPVCTGSNGIVGSVTRVQTWKSTGPTSATSVSVAMTTSPTVGNLLVAAVAVRANQTATVSDSAGNTWVSLPAQVNANGTSVTAVQLWYAPVTVGGANTVTAASSPAAYLVLAVSEYSGAAISGTIVANYSGVSAGSTTTAMGSGSVSATSPNNSWVVAAFADAKGNNATAMTIGSGYSLEKSVKNTNYLLLVEDNTSEATGSYGPAATDSNSDNWWAGVSAVFNASCVTLTNLTPAIASLSPSGSAVAGGNSLVITGSQFGTSATVTVGGTSCPVTATSGMTSITCTVPAGTAGAANVVVTNANGHTGTLTEPPRKGAAGRGHGLKKSRPRADTPCDE